MFQGNRSTEERWLPVVGFESQYEVSDKGQVRRGETLVRVYVNKTGYRSVRLAKQFRWYPVHRLVLLAFVGSPPKRKTWCNHINGVKGDNRVENLEWVSPQENTWHAQYTGKIHATQWCKSKKPVLSARDIPTLRLLDLLGETQEHLECLLNNAAKSGKTDARGDAKSWT